ncbi:MAG: hybrid sensor histidine kinase/response regulator [Chloroflexi bacterium]|nr:hybrid sensor histidine kinase/response regulator [Chloroflexota bacterium]
MGQEVILIVDDNPANRDMLARRIQQLGYEYDEAENGIQALEKLRENSYDLVLLDIMMPLMNGFETLEKIMDDSDLRQIPVIIISAIDDMTSVVKCIEMGAEDYLPKPFNAILLKARISSLLEKRRLRDAEIQRLTELNAMKDQFVRTVSHDLRNPITIIRGYADVILDLNAGSDVDDFAQRIRRSADRMLELVNDLLDLAKIESGIEMNFAPTPLAYFLGLQMGEFDLMARNKNITLSYEAPPDSLTLQLDAQRFTQVIHNLLSNAIKYTPPGGRVLLTAFEENDAVIIQVSDNGLGIPDEDIPFLFDKFYRVDTDEHKVEKGSGLGLSIVKAIVEAHDGKIGVESRLGEGSTFYVSLPLQVPVN